MKKLFFLALVVLSAHAQAQEVTELGEAVVFAPNAEKIIYNDTEFSFVVNETYQSEFVQDPISFMKANFNIHEFISFSKDKNYDTYMVTFKSSRAQLDVDFDKRGELIKNKQYLKDVKLPDDILNRLKREYPGWVMLKNKYFSTGNGELTEKSHFTIKLANGNKIRRVKLEPPKTGEIVLVQN